MDTLPPPESLDFDPPVLWGCTACELRTLATMTFPPSLLVLLVLLVPLGVWPAALPLAVLLTLAGVWGGARLVGQVRRGRPPGYFEQWFELLLQRLGARPRTLIRRAGPWCLGRTTHAR